MTSYSSAIARAIAAQGVRHTFGLMGAGTIELVHHLTTEHDVAYHAARHEAGGVGAADGYARASGDVGVCLITWGPALTNTLTALNTARKGASPVVLIAGDSSTMPLAQNPFAGGTQGVDAERLITALDVSVRRVVPATAAADVADGFDEARARRRPVVLLLPAEAMSVPVPDAAAQPRPPAAAPAPLAAAPDALAAAQAALAAAQRPLILAGRGAAQAGAGPALRELADRTGALVATTLRGIGLFDGHPYNLNVAGGFARPEVADLLAQTDCVLAFGAGLNLFTTKMGRFFADAVVVQVDVDGGAFQRYTRAGTPVSGDARLVAEALLAGLPADPAPATTAYRALADAAQLDPTALIRTFPDVSQDGALDPRAVCRRLDALLPADRTVVSDGGQFAEYPVESMRFSAPEDLLWMMDFGAVGSGLGAAIGAALARPSRTTVAFIGDGGFFMTMGDLDLAVRDAVPLLVVCMNDRAYGSELYHMRDLGVPADAAFFATPDLAGVARAMGCEAQQIRRLDELDALGDRLAARDGPLFLDVLLTQELLPAPFREH